MGIRENRTEAPAEGGPGARLRLVASIAVSIALVAGLLMLLVALRARVQGAALGVVDLLPVGYAFGAGLIASVNPCGFMMLPSYITYQLGMEGQGSEGTSSGARVARALALGLVASIAFVAVFASIGAVVSTGGRWVISLFPYGGVATGAVMAALGAWLLVGRSTIGIMAASRVSVAPRRNLANVFLFGAAYALGSLSCTLPVFLVVVGTALTTEGALASLGQFVSYSLGMAAILMAVTLGTALFRHSIADMLRAALPHVQRTSALFLLGAGAYLVYYWVFYSGAFL